MSADTTEHPSAALTIYRNDGWHSDITSDQLAAGGIYITLDGQYDTVRRAEPTS